MKNDSGTGHKTQVTTKTCSISAAVTLFFALILSLAPCASCQDKWPGVDETVVEKFAGEHGRKAREPLLNTDSGDLLLFFFLIAGAAGGFAAGYYWRMLTEGKSGIKPAGSGAAARDKNHASS